MHFKTLDQWLDWQISLNPREIELGLSRISTVAHRLNLLSPSFPIISVAGTNGKGSSVTLLDAILSAAGYRVGRYTSPHLLRYNERICIGGIEATDAELCQAFDLIEEVRDGIALTFFEFNTLAALLLFQHNEIDLAVLEVGLGGRLDAVNIFDPDIALVTAIDIDHTDWLGHDRESIGFEKAGIFRAQCPAVCSDANPPQRLIEHATQLQAPLYCLGHDFTYQKNNEKTWNWQVIENKTDFKEFKEFRNEDSIIPESKPVRFGSKVSEVIKSSFLNKARFLNLPLPRLPGDFQLQNAAGVLMVLTLLNHGKRHFFVSESAIHEGLIHAKILGRFQVLSGRVTRILDVAHNPASAKALADLLRQHPCQGKTHAVVGMLKDKDIAGVLAVMRDSIDYWHIAPLPLKVPRAASLKCLSDHLETMGITHRIIFSASITKAYQYAIAHAQEEDRVIVFGSFYAVAEVLRVESLE